MINIWKLSIYENYILMNIILGNTVSNIMVLSNSVWIQSCCLSDERIISQDYQYHWFNNDHKNTKIIWSLLTKAEK